MTTATKNKGGSKAAAGKKSAGFGHHTPEHAGTPAEQEKHDSPEAKAADKAADEAAKKAGLPTNSLPPAPRGGPPGNRVADSGGVTIQLPQVAVGRYAPPEEAAKLEPADEKKVTERAKELLKEKDRIPSGTPADRAAAARAEAVNQVLAEKALDGMEDKKAKERSGVTKEDAERLEKERLIREQVYRGADFINNPRAYAKDPNDAADQGPAEPIPVDYRRIQDEEGRLAGNFKAPA